MSRIHMMLPSHTRGLSCFTQDLGVCPLWHTAPILVGPRRFFLNARLRFGRPLWHATLILVHTRRSCSGHLSIGLNPALSLWELLGGEVLRLLEESPQQKRRLEAFARAHTEVE